MSSFANLGTEGLEESEDRIGGYSRLESDIYTGTIKALYGGKSTNGALSVSLILDIDGKEYRETFYVTNRTGKENYYHPKNKEGKRDTTKKVGLPGFVIVDELLLVTTGKGLSENSVEERVINLYNSTEKKELPTGVDMFVEAIGQKVSLAIVKSLVNKSEKSGDEYVPTAETREENTTDKVFHAEKRITVPEAKAGQEEPKFWDSWLEKNKGETRDKRTIKEGQAGAPRSTTAPVAGSTTAAPRKSLFGNK